MCRSIKTLREPFTEDVTDSDVEAAALQYVRKISGFRAPAAHNAAAFDAAVAAVAKREPLINVKVERERFDATLKDEMNLPEIAKIGVGNVDMARLSKSIDILVDANQLPSNPKAGDIFTPAFLPPAAELPHKLF